MTAVTFGEREILVTFRDGRMATTVAPPEFSRNSSFITDLVRREVRVEVRRRPIRPRSAGARWPSPRPSSRCSASPFTAPRPARFRRSDRGRGWPIAARTSSRSRTSPAWTRPRTRSRRSSTSCANRSGSRRSAGGFRRASCSSGRRAPARRCWPDRSPAKRVPFLFASGSDFVEMYAGVGASRVRKLFRDARVTAPASSSSTSSMPSGSRGGNSLSHEEREQTLNQLLVEMDGFEGHQGIVIIAATNRQDILDPALLRPGRFDRQVTVGNPDLKGREAILRVHARKINMDPDGRPPIDRARHARLLGRRPREPGQRGRAVRRPRQPDDRDQRRHARGARQGADGRRAAVGRAERARSRELRLSRGRPRRGRRAAARGRIRCTRSRSSRAAGRWA